MGEAGARRPQNRQESCGRRIGSGRSRLRSAARPRRPSSPSVTRSTPRRAVCCATAFPTSRWRRAISTAASSRWKPKASSSTTTLCRARRSAPGALSTVMTPSRSRAAPRRLATCPFQGATSRAFISRWSSCRSRTAGSAGEPLGSQRAGPGRRQACRGHRRRRHGVRLYRHVDPPGRGEGHPARDHADAAQGGGQAADLAKLAAEIAHLLKS